MNLKEYYPFMGEFMHKSILCENAVNNLLITPERALYEIASEKYNFNKKINIFREVLGVKYPALKRSKPDFDLIKELHSLREIRNAIVHGMVRFTDDRILIRKIADNEMSADINDMQTEIEILYSNQSSLLSSFNPVISILKELIEGKYSR